MNLFFYDVDTDYVKYLKAAEKAKRGFTCVPDVEYKNERKMVCGVVLEMNGYKFDSYLSVHVIPPQLLLLLFHQPVSSCHHERAESAHIHQSSSHIPLPSHKNRPPSEHPAQNR